MKVRLVRMLACALACGGIMLIATGTAAARPAHHHRRTHRAKAAEARAALMHYLRNDDPLASHAPKPSSPGGATSYNWSGYADSTSTTGEFSSVAGQWNVPKLATCPTQLQAALAWVGLDGWSDETVEQDGTIQECYQGSPYYYTWWEMAPTNDIQVVGSSVSPGDTIKASVTYSGGSYTLAVTDVQNPSNSFSTTQACSGTCENSSAEWIGERPDYGCCGFSPFAKEGTWTLTNGTQQDVSETAPKPISAGPSPTAVTMIGAPGYALSTPSALASSGNKFTDVWDNSW